MGKLFSVFIGILVFAFLTFYVDVKLSSFIVNLLVGAHSISADLLLVLKIVVWITILCFTSLIALAISFLVGLIVNAAIRGIC